MRIRAPAQSSQIEQQQTVQTQTTTDSASQNVYPASRSQRRLQEAADGSHIAMRQATMQETVDTSPRVVQARAFNQEIDNSSYIHAERQTHEALFGAITQNALKLSADSQPTVSTNRQIVQRVTGLHLSVDAYAEGLGGLLENWEAQLPQVRANAALALVNARLAAIGVPGIVSVTLTDGSPGFIDETWTMVVPNATCNFADPSNDAEQRNAVKQMMADMYHEGRHAEQMFRAARQYKIENAGADRGAIQSRFKMPNAVADAVVANAGGALADGEGHEATAWRAEVGRVPHAADSPADLVEDANSRGVREKARRIFEEFMPAINTAIATMTAQPHPITDPNHAAAVDAIVLALAAVATQYEAMRPMFNAWYGEWAAYHALAIERDAHNVGWAVEARLGLPAINIAASTVENAWTTLRAVFTIVQRLTTSGPNMKARAEILDDPITISGEDGEGLRARIDAGQLSQDDLDNLLLEDCGRVEIIDANNWTVFTTDGKQSRVHMNVPVDDEEVADWGTIRDYKPAVLLVTVQAFVAEAIQQPAAFRAAFDTFRTALQAHMNSRNRDIPNLPL